MQLLDRFTTGFTLARDSVSVLRHNPKLLLFPVVSGLAALVFLATFLGVTFGFLELQPDVGADLPEWATMASLAVLLGSAYLGLTFIASFFTAALVHQVRAVFAGEDPSLRAGVAGAWEARRPLLVWAAISATIGLVLNSIEESNSTVGRGLGALFGVAWTLLTFFVIPVVVFEKPSVRAMFTRSASTFKDTWGETPISLGVVTVLAFLVALPFALPGFYLLSNTDIEIAGTALIVVGAVLSTLVAHSLKGIIKTSLYFYATEGSQPDEFDDVDFAGLGRDADEQSAGTGSPQTGGFRP